MSEKKSGPSGRAFRPDGPAAPPPKELIDELLNEEVGGSDDKAKKAEDTLSPTASEIKTAMKNLTVGTTTNLTTHKRLDPSAPEFTPGTSASSSSVRLNPNSTEFTPREMLLPSKQLPSSTALDPTRPEFVPGSKSLNVSASAFVPKVGLPTSMQNGDLGMGPDDLDDGDIKNIIPNEEEVPILETQDVVGRFERIAEVSESDREGCEQLLKATAELLLKATMYPGSFDRLKLNVASAVEKWPPADSTLLNLAEMITYWGISEPSLRYSASRAAQEISILVPELQRFKKPLFMRLQSWYNAWKTECQDEPLTEDRKYHFINLCLFCAEVFVRVRVGDVPVRKFGKVIVEFVEKLLQLKEENTVICACHILKLTGVYLEQSDSSVMENLVKELQSFSSSSTLSNKTIDLIKRVVKLQEKKWDKLEGSKPTTSTQPTAKSGAMSSSLNTDAPIFVPSREIEFDCQQPVRNAEEWKEYLVEEDIDFIEQPDFGVVVDDDEGLDPEIELEMEAFIDEIEEHLMMQDFDPELEYNQQ